MTSQTFSNLGVDRQFTRVLEKANFHTPTDIQRLAIPVLLQGGDVLGIAQTGTGKTAAFGLPLLQQLMLAEQPRTSRQPRALILAPTRELASQILRELQMFAQDTSLRSTCIFGGVGQHAQVRALRAGVDVLIATPGRLLDLIGQNELSLAGIQHLVLDEADRLLDLGFARDIKKVAAMVPEQRQTLLFSATMPDSVAKLANQLLHHPERIDVSPKQVTVAKINQAAFFVDKPDKQDALTQLLQLPGVSKAIVFTRTKYGADRVVRKLTKNQIAAEAIHGNKSQNARTRALANFTSGKSWVLVATDIAARGIDIAGVSHVINFELPQDPESYVHRIGRTGRAGAEGVAWSLVDSAEKSQLKTIEKLSKNRLPVAAFSYEGDIEIITEGEMLSAPPAGKPAGTGSGETTAGNSRRRRPRRRRSGNKRPNSSNNSVSAG